MRSELINSDELKLTGLGFSAEVYDVGNNEAEVRLTLNNIASMKEDRASKKAREKAAKITKYLTKRGYRNIYYLADSKNDMNRAFSGKYALPLDHSEYMMSWRFSEGLPESDGGIVVTSGAEDDTDIEEKDAIVINSVEKDVFSAHLMPFRDGMYIYEVEVKEDMRNKGFGTKYMLSLMNSFKDMTLFLQVGSKNVAAVKLYRKLGFEVTEEVCYYKG